MSAHGDRGAMGERAARAYLEAKGLRFVGANLRVGRDEVDLLMREGETLVFVEVKLRKDHHLAKAREFVTPAKQRKVRIAAQYYLLDHPTQLQPRFDVIEVYAPQGRDTAQPEICHWENAF